MILVELLKYWWIILIVVLVLVILNKLCQGTAGCCLCYFGIPKRAESADRTVGNQAPVL